MAVLQENKQKVHPVMDYQEVKQYVDTYTTNADVCVPKLRDWQQEGSDIAMLNLRRAYLQIHMDKSL